MPSDTMKVQLRMWSVMTRMEISVFSFWPVGLAGDVLHMVQHALDGVHLEQVAHALPSRRPGARGPCRCRCWGGAGAHSGPCRPNRTG